MTGFINLNKTHGKTSFDMVYAVRKLLGRKTKVGHAGTLDPFATGVLIICVGKATRLAKYPAAAAKEYIAEFTFGATSDTDDCDGQITHTGKPLPESAQIVEALKKIEGTISQIPPAFSAVHINGQRAYELARAGQDPKIKPREVTIHSITLDNFSDSVAKLTIKCSKGTYIRSIARDLGQILGCGAYCSALTRSAIGNFTLENSVSAQDLTKENISLYIQDPLTGLEALPKVQLSNRQSLDISHGKLIEFPDDLPTGEIAAIASNGQLAAIVSAADKPNILKPQIVLTRPEQFFN